MTCAKAFGAPGQRREHEEGNTSDVGPLVWEAPMFTNAVCEKGRQWRRAVGLLEAMSCHTVGADKKSHSAAPPPAPMTSHPMTSPSPLSRVVS